MPNHNSLINNTIKPVDQFKAPEIKPVTTQVNKPNDTVEGRINNLTEKGSRYTNLAASDARRNANSRGLINSSISAAAGTEAAIKAALPIAQQDAKTYTDTRVNNQNIENKFLENRQGANLNQEVAAQGSRLKQGEMRLGDTLQQSQNAQNADLNIKVATAQSGLTNQENTLLNELTMKRDQGLSALTQQEQAQLNQLEIKRDAAQSGNVINQQNNQSGLTRQENAQLNDLSMKRDQGLSTLTQQENAQLDSLQRRRDSLNAGYDQSQAILDNQLAINRDSLSAGLNKELAILESGLKQGEMKLDAGLRVTVENALQDNRFSDQAKMEILTSMNDIIRDTAQQIATVGTSDRSAAQQVAAIQQIKKNRDAQLKVYSDLLKSFPDWNWQSDLTPSPTGPAVTTGQGNIPGIDGNPPSTDRNNPPSGGGSQIDPQNGARLSNDGKWVWNGSSWQPYNGRKSF